MNAYQQLEALFTKLDHLEHLSALANWDEAVMMPSGGGPARAEAMATLQTVQHELLTDPKVSELLAKANNNPPGEAWANANLKRIQKLYTQATCLPSKLVGEIAEKSTRCEQAWRKLRGKNNWHEFEPKLTELFQLIYESANIRAEYFNQSPYDVLLDEYSPSLSQSFIEPIFENLKTQLPQLIKTIVEKQKTIKPLPLTGPFAIDKQRKIGLQLMQAIGFDFNHGRLDVSHHPFCGGVPSDVRLTTRYREDEFVSAIMGICHETGHACYEQHLPENWRQQPVGKALGMSVHESQSLLIEMQACRSSEFLSFLAPLIQAEFGNQKAFAADNLALHYAKVEPSLIRVDADEVTYPLHVILRYEIERDLFARKIQIKDLPEVWQAKMQSYLGLSTKDDYQNGVMQDVHWPAGIFGYFPAYTIGRLIAAQLYQTALTAKPNIPQQLAQGDFTDLMGWLKQHVHSRASFMDMQSLLQDATGNKLNANYFINDLKQRYSIA
ncbi:MAG: carboxypeptidase M32 [Gammaproteobacteria bacterium]|nr:carboxypeptidase M32 [Gammaproteobacteria bacterium]